MNLNPSKLISRWLAPAMSFAVLAHVTAAGSPGINADYRTVLRAGDARELAAALDTGALPNAVDEKGNTPLMLAAVYGDAASMRVLLERGALINATNQAGATALMRASGDAAKLRLLLEHGADVNARTVNGQTALMLAARTSDSHEEVALLLKHGADANAASVFGATCLMAAVAGGDVRSVRLLLEHGANPNTRATPDEPGFLFGGGRSPLMWAAFRGDTRIVKLLIKAGAEINAVDVLGTPLAQATWADRNDAARLLLAHGAKPELTGFMDGYTPLHWAASSEESNAALVKLLVQHGADPNAAGGEPVDAFMGTPQTPLMLARRRGDDALIQSLLNAGATRETPDRVAMPSVAPSCRCT